MTLSQCVLLLELLLVLLCRGHLPTWQVMLTYAPVALQDILLGNTMLQERWLGQGVCLMLQQLIVTHSQVWLISICIRWVTFWAWGILLGRWLLLLSLLLLFLRLNCWLGLWLLMLPLIRQVI